MFIGNNKYRAIKTSKKVLILVGTSFLIIFAIFTIALTCTIGNQMKVINLEVQETGCFEGFGL